MKSLSVPMKASIGIAVLAFVVGTISGFMPNPLLIRIHSAAELMRRTNMYIGLLNLSVWLAWAWVISVLAASYVDRWRASWLLLTAPLVLFWPVAAIYLGTCGPFGGCNPVLKLTAG